MARTVKTDIYPLKVTGNRRTTAKTGKSADRAPALKGKVKAKTATFSPLAKGSLAMSEQMETATQNMMKMYEEMTSFARGAMDANMKSVTAVAHGWNEGSQNAGHVFQENMSRLINAGKSVAEVKSVHDFVAMQQDLMKECVDLWMTGATRLSEISARTMKDVFEPMTQHANDAIGRMMQKARAVA